MKKAIDVSSYQPRILTNLIIAYTPDHVIVKLYLPEESVSQDHSRAQLLSALANNCTVGGYIWCYSSLDPKKSVIDALKLAASVNVKLPILWLDIEELYFPKPWIDYAIRTCNELGQRVGIYTGRWVWNTINVNDYGNIPLWAAQYDNNPDLSSTIMFGGWTKASGKQYSSVIIDLNVMEDAVTEIQGGDLKTVIECLDIIWAKVDAAQRLTSSVRIEQILEDAKQQGIVELKRTLGIQ